MSKKSNIWDQVLKTMPDNWTINDRSCVGFAQLKVLCEKIDSTKKLLLELQKQVGQRKPL